MKYTIKGLIVAAFAVFCVGSIYAVRPSTYRIKATDKVVFIKGIKSGVPTEINYQGWLGSATDTTGVTGTFNLKFRLYNTETGGTPVWNETQSAVNVDKGIFNVLLGSVSSIPSEIFTGDPLWLETQVATETLSPRKKLVSVGYAIKSSTADIAIYADTANYVAGADVDGEVAQANHADTAGYASSSAPDNDWTLSGSKLYAQNTSWNVGIGTTSPSTVARLHVDANGASYGVYGRGYTGKLAGVCGLANGASYGVYGWGFAGKTAGMCGYANGANYGVLGTGYTDKIAGVYGSANGAYCGVYGIGSAGHTAGMYVNANGAYYGIYGQGSAGKSAGVLGFDYGASYGVYSDGNMGCNGTKSAVVRTSRGPTEMYCIEATELWFEDFGTGKLVNGQAQIDLAKDFFETVTIDANNPMKVFIQLADDCNGVYVKKGLTGFEVMELGSGTSNANFDYRIVAKRKNYETQRMKVVESCYMDNLLYPDDNDPAIPLKWRKVRQKQSEAEIRIKEAITK